MKRILPTLVSIFTLCVAYWGYASVVVPMFRADVPLQQQSKTSRTLSEPLPAPESKYGPLFRAYFPAGHWIIESAPKVIESGQGEGLFVLKEYTTHDDGRITIEPCVMIYFPTPWSRDGGTPPRDAVILEAPDGAVIQLDEPVQLSQGRVGEITSARLLGKVYVRSDMERAGPADDLQAQTRNVLINEKGIYSESHVDLRLGPHWGSGENLEVRFMRGTGGKRKGAWNVGGIQSIQLQKQVRLHMAPESDKNQEKEDHSQLLADRSNITDVELACSGPLYINLPKRVAEFERDVQVLVNMASGPSDRLACQLLRITFAEEDEPSEHAPSDQGDLVAGTELLPAPNTVTGASQSPVDRSMSSLQTGFRPVKLEAIGRPVTLFSPSRDAEVRCRLLQYDIDEQQVVIDAEEPRGTSWVRHDQYRLQAPRIEYKLDAREPHSRVGTLLAAGPGRIVASDEELQNQETLSIEYQDSLQLIRQDGRPVVSVFGRPVVSIPGRGSLAANDLHLWLTEQSKQHAARSQVEPSGRKKLGLLPNLLMARGSVEVDSTELAARLQHLEVHFRAVNPQQAGSREAEISGRTVRNSSSWLSPTGQRDAGTQKFYSVRAERMQLQAEMPTGGDLRDMVIADASLGGQVALRQSAHHGAQNAEFSLQADRLHVADAHTDAARLRATGSSVVIQTPDATIHSGEVLVDQAANTLHIPQAGDISLSLQNDLEGQSLSRAVPVTLRWAGDLAFDGTQVVIQRDIHVEMPDNHLQTQRLVARLQRPIVFGNTRLDAKADVESVACTGGVIIDRQTVERGTVVARDHANLQDLTIQHPSGRMYGTGPGWIRSVRLGRGDDGIGGRHNLFTSGPSSVSGGSRTPSNLQPEPGLSYVRVDFQREMVGQLNDRQVEFRGDARCVYGPTSAWDKPIRVDGLARLPEKTFVLSSSILRVDEQSRGGSKWYELLAADNVEVEGGLGKSGLFTARGARLSYDERKDLLVLDGGAGAAEIVREATLGDSRREHVAFQKIHFSPSRNELTGNGMRRFHAGGL